MSDTTLRISVVINKELDPDVYEMLTSIHSSKSRSEFARILMRAGAVKEIKSRRIVTAKASESPRADKFDPDSLHAEGISKPLKSGAGQGGKPGKAMAALAAATAPHQTALGQVAAGVVGEEDDFVDGFVTWIQGVPKR